MPQDPPYCRTYLFLLLACRSGNGGNQQTHPKHTPQPSKRQVGGVEEYFYRPLAQLHSNTRKHVEAALLMNILHTDCPSHST